MLVSLFINPSLVRATEGEDSAYVFIKDTTEDEIAIDGIKVSLDIPLSEALNCANFRLDRNGDRL